MKNNFICKFCKKSLRKEKYYYITLNYIENYRFCLDCKCKLPDNNDKNLKLVPRLLKD